MSIALWRKRRDFKLSEAALLLAGYNPDNFTDDALLTRPPEGFKAIYGAMLSDAVNVIDEHEQSQVDPDVYFTRYALMTDKPAKVSKLSDNDGLVVRVARHELEEWAGYNTLPLGLLDASGSAATLSKPLAARERTSLHHIIGAMKEIVLAHSEAFDKQDKLIAYLTDKYQGYEGISKSNLEKVFAEANRLLGPS